MIKLFFGASAAGKDTLLKQEVEHGVKPIVTCTTRPMRTGEVNGKDYIFLKKDTFLAIKNAGGFFETRKYNTLVRNVPDSWYYGSMYIKDAERHNYAAVVDIAGVKAYIDAYGVENVEPILVYVPNDIREKRAKLRGSFDQSEWNRRLEDDKVRFSEAAIKELEESTGIKVKRVNNY